MQKNSKIKLIKQVGVLFILLSFIFSTFNITFADFKTVPWLTGGQNELFTKQSTSLNDIGDQTESPLKHSTQYNQIGLDIILGNSRQLVTYKGEIFDDSNYYNANGNSYYYNPESSKIDATEYWGEGVRNKDFNTLQEEAKNGTTNSLRLYALENTESVTFSIFTPIKWLYSGIKGLTSLANWILGKFIWLKNLSMQKFLDALQLDTLIGLFNKVFLGDPKSGNTKRLSIFMVLALISAILAIIGVAISYAHGGTKNRSLRDIIITLLLGFALVGASISGKLPDLGTQLANITETLMAASVDSIGENAEMFKTTSSGLVATETSPSGETMIIPAKKASDSDMIAYNEMSILNKAIIDAQLQIQFGCSIKELNLDGPKAKDYELIIGKGDYDDSIKKNIGYTFWVANSPVEEVTKTNWKKFGTNYSTAHLADFVTELQKAVNDDALTLNTGQKVMRNLANPAVGSGIFTLLLIFAIFVMMVLSLWQIVLKIAIAKILVAGSIVGIPIAGPLIISSRDKFVKIGRMIVFMFVTYSIQIFILSVVFDLILNIMGFLLSDINTINLILALILAIALFMWLPLLLDKLKLLFASIDQSISPELTSFKRSAQNGLRSRFLNFKNNYNAGTKTKTWVDKDGNVQTTTVSRKGDLLSNMMEFGYNSMASGSGVRSNFSVFRSNRKNAKAAEDAMYADMLAKQKAQLRADSALSDTSGLYEQYKDSVYQDGNKDTDSLKTINIGNIKDEHIRDEAVKAKDAVEDISNLKNILAQKEAQLKKLRDEYGGIYESARDKWEKHEKGNTMSEEEKLAWSGPIGADGKKDFSKSYKGRELKALEEITEIKARLEKARSIAMSESSVLEKIRTDVENRSMIDNKETILKDLDSKLAAASTLLMGQRHLRNDNAAWAEIAALKMQRELIAVGDTNGFKQQTPQRQDILEAKQAYMGLSVGEERELNKLHSARESSITQEQLDAQTAKFKQNVDNYLKVFNESSLKVDSNNNINSTSVEAGVARTDIMQMQARGLSLNEEQIKETKDATGKSVVSDRGAKIMANQEFVSKYNEVYKSTQAGKYEMDYRVDRDGNAGFVVKNASTEADAKDRVMKYAESGGKVASLEDINNIKMENGQTVRFSTDEMQKLADTIAKNNASVPASTAAYTPASAMAVEQKVTEVIKHVDVPKNSAVSNTSAQPKEAVRVAQEEVDLSSMEKELEKLTSEQRKLNDKINTVTHNSNQARSTDRVEGDTKKSIDKAVQDAADKYMENQSSRLSQDGVSMTREQNSFEPKLNNKGEKVEEDAFMVEINRILDNLDS